MGILLFIGSATYAQKPQNTKVIEKLRTLYQEGKFLKLEFKCYNLSMHDEVKREPLLYLYWSMANYEIAKAGTYEEDYPKAYKDAIKYGIKFARKDKEKEFLKEGGEHLKLLQDEVLASAEDFLAEGNLKKARSQFKVLTKFDKFNFHAWFMKSYLELELKLTNDARVTFETAMKLAGAQEALEGMKPEVRDRLKEEFLS